MQTYKTVILFFGGVLLLTGCATSGRVPPVTLRFHEEVSRVMPEVYAREVEIPATRLKLRIHPYPALTEKDVQVATLYPTAGGDAVMLQFDAHGMFAFGEMTTRCKGGYLVVLLNDRPVAAWLVDRRIDNGQFLLEGAFSDEEAQQIVDGLNKISGRRRDFGDVR